MSLCNAVNTVVKLAFCVRRSNTPIASLNDIPERSRLESCCVNINTSRRFTRPAERFSSPLAFAASTANGK
ncbi:MAG: hypothetical protein PCFJNLEI_03584 [Verrucomicrobiae bacterium]|nr:hypothetical protein [Verrucomicrobiae bacterium]